MKQSKSISPNAVTAAFMPVSSLKQINVPASKDKNSWQQLPVQCKLSVGAVDDPLEQEADAMADKVMCMPGQNFVQRKKCAHCEEEQLRKKPAETFIQKNACTVPRKKK